ncbi:hypothetical protein HQ535_11900 [bacterium]|nr:hypothetical protein [bacterium]
MTAQGPVVDIETQPIDRPRHGSWIPRLTPGLMAAIAALFAFFIMRPDQILASNTPTGGDMGAHVLIPAYLRDTLIPGGRVMGWSMDWYAGFPVLYFYFPLPAFTIVALDVLLPYGVAFKLVTVAGLVALPFASYYFARSMGFSRPVAAVGGVAGATFIYMESFSIFGGNTLSTLAGEYSFSWSFALSLVYLGMVIKSVREGRGFTIGAGVVLALAALSHVITTLVVVLVSLPLFFKRKGPAAVAGAWGLGFAIAAFWAVPLLARVNLTSDMQWFPVTGFEPVLPRELWPIVLLASAGLAYAVSKRYIVGPAIAMAVLPVAGYYLIQFIDYRKLYNARLLPYWYYVAFLFAGLAVGVAVVAVARRLTSDPRILWGGVAMAGMFFLLAAGLGVNKAPSWARWNYSGYEGKTTFPEYEGLMETLDGLPEGRVMWEANNDLNKYGTPMALMLTGYWSDGHPSMEGLLFESSLTTPFHFLNAAEVSKRPSNPIPGLDYHRLDSDPGNFERGIVHLGVYGVAYYVSFTDEANEAAVSAGLEILEVSPPFTVYALPETPLIEVAPYQPVVYDGEDGFVDAALDWYGDIDGLDRWMVADGPEDWPRVETVGTGPRRRLQTDNASVSDVVLDDHRISFTTTAVGVPHLVKVSYFPNWTAVGADGPYRAAPSLMIVVPTDNDVVIEFSDTWAETSGRWITISTIVGLGAWWFIRRRRAKAELEAAAA